MGVLRESYRRKGATMLRLFGAIAGLTASLLTVSCGGSDSPTAPPDPTIHGTYILENIEGQTPPTLLNASLATGCAFYVVEGSLEFREDQTFSWVENGEERCDNDTTQVELRESGSFTLTDGHLDFSNPDLESGTWNGDVVIVEVHGRTLFREEVTTHTHTYRR